MSQAAAAPAKRGSTRPSRPTDCTVQCINDARVARAAKAMRPEPDVTALAEVFGILGDPAKLRIVSALGVEELCVCDLASLLGMSASAVSHALRSLRQVRLVTPRKEGRVVHYRLAHRGIADLIARGFRHQAIRSAAGR